ncbi:fumarylacetoacetate hydrolase family protein [Aquabacter spiritensis]|uniref:2-keto-4-pentenoate hydratase/2-oxohepta-3-ene-1,7-dioic acid hydratase in catechol pathway n=1 Tax=Aquabacter spiritensis TaxID=933073 RepID=A0A4R3LYK5_9HYPH|nr:fumarylacetoacetate hydrolase family protein [Aquabacter spiritensis]TCT03845.1 2-keto-4-pentenoate hydratase/2-oxohepta-3-ene-1,7-dioic acid hydratase in catechol pathway [Aquabacter spiritensis]
MKLATYDLGGTVRVGLVSDDETSIQPIAAADMLDAIVRWDEIAGALAGEDSVPLSRVRLLAPIPHPRRNIICVGKNYRDHAKEFALSGFEAGAVAGAEIDTHPAVFTKPASTVIGPDAEVDTHPGVTDSIDYEVELALVIGRGGKGIKAADAFSHIFGYTIVNDVTARDLQKSHKQWFIGKSLDTFCPMGPWITTADALDAENLDVKTWVNGELRQNANTRDLIFTIPSLIETISAGMTLEPGDIIATGTPSGVGIGFKPPKFLKSGDVVKLSISGIGELTNRFA